MNEDAEMVDYKDDSVLNLISMFRSHHKVVEIWRNKQVWVVI
jgi:hypothetical protein